MPRIIAETLSHKISLGLGAAALLMTLTVPMAQASVTPQNVDPVAHYFDCWGVLITDSDAHHKYCSPSRVMPSNETLATTSNGGAAGTVEDKDHHDRHHRHHHHHHRSYDKD